MTAGLTRSIVPLIRSNWNGIISIVSFVKISRMIVRVDFLFMILSMNLIRLWIVPYRSHRIVLNRIAESTSLEYRTKLVRRYKGTVLLIL